MLVAPCLWSLLVFGCGLQKRTSAPFCGLMSLRKDFSHFSIFNIIITPELRLQLFAICVLINACAFSALTLLVGQQEGHPA